jgi:hypothetical protein
MSKKLKTIIRKRQVERTTRGIYAENNAPRYGTGKYDTYYDLYLKKGLFEKKVSSSTSETIIKNKKFDFDRVLQNPRNTYKRKITKINKDIILLEKEIKIMSKERCDLEDLLNAQIIIKSL